MTARRTNAGAVARWRQQLAQWRQHHHPLRCPARAESAPAAKAHIKQLEKELDDTPKPRSANHVANIECTRDEGALRRKAETLPRNSPESSRDAADYKNLDDTPKPRSANHVAKTRQAQAIAMAR